MEKNYKNNRKRRRKHRRKLAQKRYNTKQAKPKASGIENHVEWLNSDKHKHLIFMVTTRVSSGQQLKNLFKQTYRIEKIVAEENLRLIDNKCVWMIKSAFYSKSKRERVEIAETEALLGQTLSYNPDRPFYKPHYKQLELLKIKMGDYPNAAFLFESLDRAIRSDAYLKENKDAPLSEGEVLEFAKVVHPYPVILICPPWATANKMGTYYKELNKGFENSQAFQDYKWFLNYCKQHNLYGFHHVDKKSLKTQYQAKVIRAFEFYLKFKDLKLEPIYKLIYKKCPEVPVSTIKLWCQEYLNK